MTTLKATYVSKSTSQVIEVPLDTSKPLTASIIDLQSHINTVLTKVLEDEKKAKKVAEKVSTVEQDAKEQELKEMNAEEDEEEEKGDSPMSVDRPETEEAQAAKKQKTDS